MRELVNYYLVYDITGSTVQLGLTGLFQLVPMLLLGLFESKITHLTAPPNPFPFYFPKNYFFIIFNGNDVQRKFFFQLLLHICLLYTSDAADE